MSSANISNIKTVLIANRGEIACRIIRTCKQYGLKSVAVYSKEDADSLHVAEADESILIPGIGAAAYINMEEIVNVAKTTKSDVVIPGYGFLSENSEFSAKLNHEGIIFAGPTAESVEQFGLKHIARTLATQSNVPVVPGTGLVESEEEALIEASKIGYPIMLKATSGGGGMGLQVARNDLELQEKLGEVRSRGETLFKNSGVFLEKYVESGRHIEVQIFGNGMGDIIALGERECSIQRRHQKVVEEAPSPFISLPKYNQAELREKLSKCAIRLASTVKYKSAGTIEFLVDDETGEFYFLEMNTRLQVEHGITELVYGVDLVYMMLLQADFEATKEVGIPLELMKKQGTFDLSAGGIAIPKGHAIEVRIYAENPVKNFAPSPGILHNVEFPSQATNCKVRVDHWISTGAKVSPYFDPLLAKVMVWGEDRSSATIGMIDYLHRIKLQGPPTNVEYLIEILKSDSWSSGFTLTSFLSNQFKFQPKLLEFEESGAYTTIQDLPGRKSVNGGVPVSGPVDPFSFQLANILVGNPRTIEMLEIQLRGPVMKFHSSAVVALTGGPYEFLINNINAPMFTEIFIPAGAIVEIGESIGQATKSYFAIKGGFPDVAYYLGSKSCTPTLSLGGHQGRTIFAGDCLTIESSIQITEVRFGYELPKQCYPGFSDIPEDYSWTIRMIRGPHDTSEILSQEGIDLLYNTTYKINLNSNRGAMRLDGPGMKFSREDGGDGGSNPSNIVEYIYPLCGLSTVGSTMVLFGLDGATLSGFCCISVPISADFWKFGQAKVGSGIKFKMVSYDDAIKLAQEREKYITYLETRPDKETALPFVDELEEYSKPEESSFLVVRQQDPSLPDVSYRQAGEDMIIIDYGSEVFTLLHNARQYALELAIMANSKTDKALAQGIQRVECGAGSMSVIFDPVKITRSEILQKIINIESSMPPTDKLKIPSRLFNIPLCFDSKAIKHCIDRYMHSQRPFAPYLPDNAAYVRRASCIDTVEQFKSHAICQPQVVVAVSFLCANTLMIQPDPRLRFMTSKYNPARTITPRGAIGTGGGGTQSIYSVDSPGGYMIWGKVPENLCWNTFSRLSGFEKQPWILQNFDQVQYYEVSEEELEAFDQKLITHKAKLEWEDTTFDITEYSKFLEEVKDEAADLKRRQKEMGVQLMKEEAESMELWEAEKAHAKASKTPVEALLTDPNSIKVSSTMAANIFKINVSKGDVVTPSDVVVVLEAMKMEIAVRIKDKTPAEKYEVLETIADEGDMVTPGDTILVVKRIT